MDAFDLSPVGVSPPVAYGIHARSLTKRYGDQFAVQNIDIAVQKGEFYGFLGPNGAGKSTTIRMLCGLLKPDSGQVFVAGRDLALDPIAVKAAIGVMPEDPALYERLTGREYLTFAGQMYGLALPESQSRAQDLLRLLELEDAAEKLIVDYSMGMKKKTAMAAALIHRPEVIFLDEPFNGIDPISVRAIRDTLHYLAQRGTTIFISSHVMEVVERLCSRFAIISKGLIVAEGTLESLRYQAGLEPAATLEDAFVAIVQPNAAREELSWL